MKHIPDVAKGVRSTRDFKSLPDRVAQIKKKMSQACTMRQENIQSISQSGDTFMTQVQTLRQQVTEIFDRLEKKTILEIDSRKTSLETKINGDVDKMAEVNENLQKLLDEIKDEGKSDVESYIGLNKCDSMIGTAYDLVEIETPKNHYAITFQPYTGILDYLSSLETLGDVTVVHVFRVESSQQHNVRVAGDGGKCFIEGACALPGGEYLLADGPNKRLKLFTQDFKLITSFDVPKYPYDVCCTGEHDAALTINNDGEDRHEILLVQIQAGKIKKTRTIKLRHRCVGLAHHGGQLYVTGYNTLHVFDLKGDHGRQLYSDHTRRYTVSRCGVSPDGSRIYITNRNHDQLITLNKDGTKLSTLTHPGLRDPRSVHVSSLGHVFICCYDWNTVVQVVGNDVSTLAGEKDGMIKPLGLCFNSSSNTLVVGQYQNNNTLELKLK